MEETSLPAAIAAGDLLHRLDALDEDGLRGWIGRLEDAEAVARAVLREKLRQQRRRLCPNA